MIYTVTLNPALDYVIQVDHFQAGQINRTKEEHMYYGGKGIKYKGEYIIRKEGKRAAATGKK